MSAEKIEGRNVPQGIPMDRLSPIVTPLIATICTVNGGSEQQVYEIERCEFVEDGRLHREPLYWIANESGGELAQIRDELAVWVQIYVGSAINAQNPADILPPDHVGLYVSREAIILDNENK